MSIYVWTSKIKNIYVWTTPVKAVYVWTQQVRPSWWTPWTNTLAYYPLTSTTTTQDKSWNNRNLTNSWVTFGTYKWVDCAYSSMSSKLYNSSFITNQQNITALVWIYYVWNGYSWNGNYNQTVWRWWQSSSENFWPYIDNLNSPWRLVCSPGGFWGITLTSDSVWKHCAITYDYTNKIGKMYIDWTFIWQNTNATPPYWTYFWLWGGRWSTSCFYWWLSEAIIENKIWTAQEILDYYNQTKSKYWL